ncbi:PQQ-like beta-propeller repeat protein [Spirosoma aureum]|uniref:PQQ-like beta-propeller repeat protein n=1 Tax=Spirosoma aureum TaxID=2692134 RepID=A0A6G9AW67_9BACT|nr:PQQ-like beta-propeller repeat protein [Spirosoma aureum]
MTQMGVQKWRFALSNPAGYVNSTLAIANGMVYACSFDKMVYALDVQTGVKKWEFATANIINSSPAVADGIVYVKSNDACCIARPEVQQQ